MFIEGKSCMQRMTVGSEFIALRSTLLLLLIIFAFGNCTSRLDLGELSFLSISKKDSTLHKVFTKPDHYELQIRYVKVDRDSIGNIDLTSYEYGIDTNRYFYPASTVKMPVAFLALEKLNFLKKQGYSIDPHTTLKIDAPRSPPQTPVIHDSTATDLNASIGHYIHKLFVVSDNDAYNRLYEFLGPEKINHSLREKGIFTNSRIVHRVGVSGYSPEENRYTNPFKFYNSDTLVYEQPEKYMAEKPFEPLEGVSKGRAYIDKEGKLIKQAFDFSQKNFVSLRDLQESLISIMTRDGRFDLGEEDYELLYKSMSMYPGDSEAPKYSSQVESSGGISRPYYYDSYVKLLMFGNSRDDIPDQFRIYNKVGFAYGYLTDCAYIVDLQNDVEFFLAATIHVNENQTYNDGIYEYDEIGIPFLDRLGDLFYEYELKRKDR